MSVIGGFWNKQVSNSPHKDRKFYRVGVARLFSNTGQMSHLDIESKAVWQPDNSRACIFPKRLPWSNPGRQFAMQALG